MKTTAIFAILAAAQGASAAWLRWTVDNEPTWSPQKTDVAMFSNALDGFTPMPTTAPGHRDLGVDVLKVLKGETEITDWTNSKTCGWLADYPSSAYTCGSSYTCATDSDHHVACIYSTLSTFYHECLDYEAVQLGSCVSIPYGTGCCYHSTQPFCGTYIWTGKPQRNMYQCFASPTVITMLDAPRTVIEASLFSKTHTTPSPTPTTSSGMSSSSTSSSMPSSSSSTFETSSLTSISMNMPSSSSRPASKSSTPRVSSFSRKASTSGFSGKASASGISSKAHASGTPRTSAPITSAPITSGTPRTSDPTGITYTTSDSSDSSATSIASDSSDFNATSTASDPSDSSATSIASDSSDSSATSTASGTTSSSSGPGDSSDSGDSSDTTIMGIPGTMTTITQDSPGSQGGANTDGPGAGSGIGIPPTDTATDLLTDSPTNALTGSVPDQTSGPLPNNTNGTTIAEPKNNTTAIVGGVLGGLLGLMILLLACCCFRKSKAKGKLGFGFTRNKAGNVKNIKNVGKDVEGGRHATNVQILGVKGRDSPVSERTITEPVPLVVNPQHQYITREEHHHHHEAPSNAPSLSHAPIMQNVHVQQQMAAAQQASSALHSSSSLGLVPVPRAESIAPSIVPPVSLHSTDSPQPVHQTHYHIYYTSPKPDETSTEVPAGQQTPTKAPKSDESSIQGQGGVLHGHTRKGSQQSKRTASPIHFDSMGTMGPSYRQSMP